MWFYQFFSVGIQIFGFFLLLKIRKYKNHQKKQQDYAIFILYKVANLFISSFINLFLSPIQVSNIAMRVNCFIKGAWP